MLEARSAGELMTSRTEGLAQTTCTRRSGLDHHLVPFVAEVKEEHNVLT